MIIPIRCFSCNNPIAHKWEEYCINVQKGYSNAKKFNKEQLTTIAESNSEKSVEGKELDKLGLQRQCCRRMFLTHADIFDKISKITQN